MILSKYWRRSVCFPRSWRHRRVRNSCKILCK